MNEALQESYRMVMRAHRRSTLVESFENTHVAEAAVRELQAVGFTASQIGVVFRDEHQFDADPQNEQRSRIGVETHWGLRTLVGFAPGIGRAVAGGLLAVLFWSTTTIGTAGALVGLGLSEEDASDYEEQFLAGHTIVAVTGGTRADIARSVLNRFNRCDRVLTCAT